MEFQKEQRGIYYHLRPGETGDSCLAQFPYKRVSVNFLEKEMAVVAVFFSQTSKRAKEALGAPTKAAVRAGGRGEPPSKVWEALSQWIIQHPDIPLNTPGSVPVIVTILWHDDDQYAWEKTVDDLKNNMTQFQRDNLHTGTLRMEFFNYPPHEDHLFIEIQEEPRFTIRAPTGGGNQDVALKSIPNTSLVRLRRQATPGSKKRKRKVAPADDTADPEPVLPEPVEDDDSEDEDEEWEEEEEPEPTDSSELQVIFDPHMLKLMGIDSLLFGLDQ